MLNRISKTILILTICLGISIPTNAAVSVSDGSAFVTKAEFAADLNNLSNRMAQLENSLDAKIDSLVSSYLTRNGIWNGAKQDIGTGYEWNGKGNFYTISNTATNLKIYEMNQWNSADFYKVTVDPKYDTKRLTIAPITKTGLMRFECDITTMGSDPIWAFRETVWSDHVSNMYQECGLIVSQTETLPSDFNYAANRLYTYKIDNLMLLTKKYNTPGGGQTVAATPFRFNPSTLHQQWYAFVNKGDILWCYYHFNATSTEGLFVRYDMTGEYRQFKMSPALLSIY